MASQQLDARQRMFSDNCDEQIAYLNQHCVYKEEPLSAKEVPNAIALPPFKAEDLFSLIGGIYDENFNTEALGIDLVSINDVGFEKYGITKDTVLEYCDETVVFGGYLHWFFGHLIYISIFERLWYVCDKIPSDIKIIFLAVGNKLTALQKDLLSSIGISEKNIIVINKPTKFKKIIVPEECIKLNVDTQTVCYSDEYLSVYNAILKNIKPSEHKKLYLTKSSYKKYGDLNVMIGERYFENFYRKKGFYVVAPEKLPIKEQIALILGADEIVGTSGTQMTLAAVMARPETKIVYLEKNNGGGFAGIYWHINKQKNLNYFFVDVSIDFLLPKFDDESIYLIGITNCWKKYVEFAYGEVLRESQDDTLKKYAMEYIYCWCKLYSEVRPYSFNTLDFIEPIDFLDNMHKVLFGTALDRTKFNITPSKWQLMNDNAALTNNINSVSEEKNKLLSEKAALEEKLQTIMGKIKEIEDLCNS